MDLNCINTEETSSTDSVCRLCINYTQFFFTVDDLNGLLEDVLPNLDLTLTSNPVVCSKCIAFITTCFNFKQMCLEKENQIRNYYDITKKTVNLRTMIKSEQSCDLSKPSIHPFINDASIKIAESQLSFDQNKQLFDYTRNPAYDISKNSFKHLFTTPTADMKKTKEKYTENICESSHRIKEESSETNIVKATINNLEVPIDSTCDDDNVMEIVESDIASDGNLDLHTDKDLMSFTELCRKGSNDKKNYDALKSEKNPITFDNNSVGAWFSPDKLLKLEDFWMIPKESIKGTKKANLYKKINSNLFSCTLCHKTFTQKVHADGHLLTKHKNISNIEKKIDSKNHYCQCCSFQTFYCAHCKYSTNHKGNLGIHLRRHNPVKPFKCQLCENSYGQKRQLNNHIIKNHAENMDNKVQCKCKVRSPLTPQCQCKHRIVE